MSVGYELAYRVGLTPWERAGEGGAAQLSRLLDREENERTRPLGRALDIGCGTGQHAVELAGRGWQAVGLDNVGRAIDRARRRVSTHPVEFVLGDVTALGSSSVGSGFDFFLDVGCFHGLADEARRQYGQQVSAVASPGATLLVLCFRPGRRIGLPRGAAAGDLTSALPGWTIVDEEAADTSGMPGPLKRTAPQWYRLRR